jgi:hypothetical protein
VRGLSGLRTVERSFGAPVSSSTSNRPRRAGRSPSAPTSTGRNATTCSRRPGRSTCARSARAPRSSSATCSGTRTRTRAGPGALRAVGTPLDPRGRAAPGGRGADRLHLRHDIGRDTRPDGGTTTTVRLSLLRAPHSPDPDADRGRNPFGYALLAGAGVESAIAGGYALNLPLRPAAEPGPAGSTGARTRPRRGRDVGGPTSAAVPDPDPAAASRACGRRQRGAGRGQLTAVAAVADASAASRP